MFLCSTFVTIFAPFLLQFWNTHLRVPVLLLFCTIIVTISEQQYACSTFVTILIQKWCVFVTILERPSTCSVFVTFFRPFCNKIGRPSTCFIFVTFFAPFLLQFWNIISFVTNHYLEKTNLSVTQTVTLDLLH